MANQNSVRVCTKFHVVYSEDTYKCLKSTKKGYKYLINGLLLFLVSAGFYEFQQLDRLGFFQDVCQDSAATAAVFYIVIGWLYLKSKHVVRFYD